eukprot:7440701-Lingulodinium_polyedra.AAC.1
MVSLPNLGSDPPPCGGSRTGSRANRYAIKKTLQSPPRPLPPPKKHPIPPQAPCHPWPLHRRMVVTSRPPVLPGVCATPGTHRSHK